MSLLSKKQTREEKLQEFSDAIDNSKTRVKENEKHIRLLQSQIARHLEIIKKENDNIAAKTDELQKFKSTYEGLL